MKENNKSLLLKCIGVVIAALGGFLVENGDKVWGNKKGGKK